MRIRGGVAAVAAGLAVALGAAMAPVAAEPASASPATEVMARADGLRERISSAQAEYLKAVADQGEAEAERDAAEAELAGIDRELSRRGGELAGMMSSSYSSRRAPLADIVTGSSDVAEVIGGIARMNRVEGEVASRVADVRRLRDERAAKAAECDARAREAASAAEEAASRRDGFKAELDGMAGEIRQVSAEISRAILDEPDKASQMRADLSYMTDVFGVTETQASIIRAAFQTSYSGPMLCENWVMRVYRNAGLPFDSYPDAYADYRANCRSTSTTDIKAGGVLYCSGTGTVYGHVGIALTDSMGPDGMDTLIIDNEGSRTGVMTLRDWLKGQRACPRNGIAGWFGWGYPDGVDLGHSA